MKTKAFLVLLALVLAMAPKVALADITTTFNTNAAGGNGFYNGSGNVDGDFTTTIGDYGGGNTIVLSLRGAQRHIGPIAPSGDDYTCVAGEQCNFEFSVATTGAFDVGDFDYLISVQDLTTSRSFSYDPMFPGNDNSYWNGGKTSTFGAGTTGMQNSEYLGFSFLGLSWQPTDEVAVYLSAVRTGGGSADPAVEMGFNTSVPEPGVLILLITMMAPLGLLARRKNLS